MDQSERSIDGDQSVQLNRSRRDMSPPPSEPEPVIHGTFTTQTLEMSKATSDNAPSSYKATVNYTSPSRANSPGETSHTWYGSTNHASTAPSHGEDAEETWRMTPFGVMVLVWIPVALVYCVTGLMFWEQCPISQQHIVYFDVILGVFLLMLTLCLVWATRLSLTKATRSMTLIVFGAGICNVMVWYVTLCVYIIASFGEVQFEDWKSADYCNGTLFYTSFYLSVLVAAILILEGLVVCVALSRKKLTSMKG
jgi:NADH:ubiquinone oxidoreductase subunit 6 (subunit J)